MELSEVVRGLRADIPGAKVTASPVGMFGPSNNTLNMLSLVGMILLLGLVGNNAILLVDYTIFDDLSGVTSVIWAGGAWS